MDLAFRFLIVGLFGVLIGMIGGIAMIKMIENGSTYIFEHPPDERKENKKGDTENEH